MVNLKETMDLLLPAARQHGLTVCIEGDHIIVEKRGLAFAITDTDIATGYHGARLLSGVKLLLMLDSQQYD